MNMPKEDLSTPRWAARFAASALASMALVVTPLQAAQTDISSTPITSVNGPQVKPNIMLLMDTSGSMGWGHMPDEVETVVGINSVGYKSAQCNILYYNPATTYFLPKKADGSLFPLPVFGAGLYDAYDTSSVVTVDLGSAFKAYDDLSLRTSGYNDTPQAAYYFTHTGPAITSYLSPVCTDPDAGYTPGTPTYTDSAGTGTWTKVFVGGAEQTNFTIWYNYYRLRISLIKSAASLAFTPLTDSFRVGFITVKPKDLPTDAGINSAKYLAIADFDSTQRGLWYDKLFSQKPSGSSPTREGLARVGRHYAGKQDGINTGMTGDPVQYSCQQNFTIMTTDGYWNDQAETPGAGPVQIDGVTPVGQQDGTLTLPSGNSPRPIWDGVPDGNQTITNKSNSYRYSPCGTYFYKTDTQISVSTVQTTSSTSQTTQSTFQNLQSTTQMLRTSLQNLQSTTQPTQSTAQNLQSTLQHRQSTVQNLQSTTQTTLRTLQNLQSTRQNLQSTNQNLQDTSQTVSLKTWVDQTVQINLQSTTQTLRSTSQNVQNTSQTRIATQQKLQSTTQMRASTNQNRQSTTQTTQSTLQNLQSTVQNLTSTSQMLQSTAQVKQTTAQNRVSTFQELQSTSQVTSSTSQLRQSTTQLRSCSAQSETCTPVPVGSCTPSADITCETVTTGPTLVASCTAASASPGNNFIATTCNATNTGPTPVLSCTGVAAGPGNSYTATTCNTTTTTSVPVLSCNPAPATIANAYTATTCTTNATGPTPASSCTAQAANAGNSFTSTVCSTNNSGPAAVASCTAAAAIAGNAWTTTTCTPTTTTNVPVASCTAAAGASGNAWTTTTCTPNNTSNVPTASCSPSGPTAGNSWVTTTCSSPNNTTNVPVATCTPSAAAAGNAWTATTCPAPATTGPTGVASCAPVAAALGNNWTQTTCGTNNTTNVAVLSCSASGPTGGNAYTTTTCPAPVTTGPTGVAACANAAATALNSWTSTTCAPNNSTNIPVAACAASGPTALNAYTTTTCPAPITTGPTPISACAPIAANAGNSFTATTCPTLVVNNTPVSACAASGPTGGNNWTTTTCPAPITTGPTGVQTCTASGANGGNLWTATTCTPNNTTSVPVTSCAAAAASAANFWTATTCPTPTIFSGPTRVQTCTASPGNAGNSYHQTICIPGSSSIPSGTCVPDPPTLANNWVTTTCNALVAGPYAVQTCTPQTGNAGNNWLTITCPAPNVTTNVPVLTCTGSASTAANSWVTTTCPPAIVTTNVPVLACTASAALVGNSWTTTTCPAAITTGPTGVASCVNDPAAAGNSWNATICGTNNTTNVAVASCAGSGPTGVNGYTTTTCGTNNTTNAPVAACSASGPTLANGYTTTTCPADVVTTNVPVASCTATPATLANSWVQTTCPAPVTTGPAPVSSCSPITAGVGNSWTTTTCGSVVTTNVAVASCTPSSPILGNNWTTTTCGTNNSISVPVASCLAQAPTAANFYTTVTCTPNNTSSVPVATCSASPASSANSWIGTTCGTNNVLNTPVSSCTPITATAGNNWVTTTCPVVTSGPTGSSSCTPTVATSGNGWTTTTCNTVNTGPTPAASCTPVPASAGNAWLATTCPTIVTGPSVVTTCVAAGANAGNTFTSTTCVPTTGNKIQYTTTTTVDVTYYSGGLPTRSDPTVTTTGGLTDLDGVCYAPNVVPPALPAPNPQPASWSAADATTYPTCSGWPCSVSSALGGARSINSLADVAQYYYVTDLRPSPAWPSNISTDDVPAVGNGAEDDRVRWQHMTTFSIALGVSGTLNYRPDYKRGTTTTGDFADIRTGVKNWPLWPDPSLDYVNDKNNWNNPRSIDDFWHAAVNGRGQYFSAGNPTSVINGLAEALAGITARLASSSGAGTSNLEPVPGDNLIYLANYTTSKWFGDVQAKEINLADGTVLPPVIWSAQAKLDARTSAACDNRNIYLFRQGATNNLTNFTWNTSACDASGNPTGAPDTGLNASEQAPFGGVNITLLSQYPSMTDGTLATADQRTPAAGANLVNYLRGQTGLQDFTPNDATKLYRLREHILGDTVDGQPIYVRGPFSSYADPGYAAFKVSNSTRIPMLYVPANDGMLHAFYAGTNASDPLGGKEAWAIIPSTVLPNLYKLADNNYKNNHAFFVDGTPTVSDMYDGTSWKTVLVAGLNDGGKGYYAIDVSNPLAPKGLWEFKWNPAVCPATTAAATGNTSDCHVGYTFGKPIITKLSDGTWVVLVTSGYNNVNAAPQAGDGEGYLYVLNATTGQVMYKIGTGAGDATTPSGLAQINNYVDKADTNNKTVRVYGTDVLGNIWRFDVNDNLAPAGREAALIGTATDISGTPQPITTRPELSVLDGSPMVFVATGRLLGASDVSDTQVQAIYGIVDPLTGSPAFANLRGALAPLAITQVGSGPGSFRTVACTGTTLQCGSGNGWIVNLPDQGERVNVEMKLRAGTLIVGSNVPQISACVNGGYSWLNYFNFKSGLAIPGGTNDLSVSEQVANSLIVGLTVIKLPDGTIRAIVTTSDANIYVGSPKFGGNGGGVKRVSWREVSPP